MMSLFGSYRVDSTAADRTQPQGLGFPESIAIRQPAICAIRGNPGAMSRYPMSLYLNELADCGGCPGADREISVIFTPQ
jgi:hypothetical protein